MEKIFFDGFRIEAPHEKAPDFVKGKVSIKVDEFIEFLQKHKTDKGWINGSLKVSRAGGYYLELDTWKPTKKVEDQWNDKTPSVDPETGRIVDPLF